jgi:hypothetical protein
MARNRSTKEHGRGGSPGQSYATPPSLCLACGYYVDRASAVTGKGRPVEGDVTVCLNCGGLHRFDVKLNLVPTSLDAVRDTLKPAALQKLILSQQFIKQRGPIPKKDKPS